MNIALSAFDGRALLLLAILVPLAIVTWRSVR